MTQTEYRVSLARETLILRRRGMQCTAPYLEAIRRLEGECIVRGRFSRRAWREAFAAARRQIGEDLARAILPLTGGRTCESR